VGERPSGGVSLAAGLGVVTLVLFATYSAVLSVVLPAQVARIDPADKVAALAVVTSVSFAVTAVAQPLIGAVSDRTRGRWGRRRPWMFAGAVIGGGAVAALGAADSVPLLAVLWCSGQFALNATDIASTSYLVDAYAPQRRARIVAVFGVAAIGGGGLGALAAGRFAATPALAPVVLAAALVIVVAAFVLLVRDPAPETPSEPFSLRRFLAGFVVNPRRHPEFSWLVASRFCFGVAYQATSGYLLFTLTDHLRVPAEQAADLVGSFGAAAAGGMLIAIVVVAWLSDLTGMRRPFLMGAALLAAAAALLALAVPEVWAVVVVAVAFGVALGATIVVGTTLASLTLPGTARDAGRGLGLFNFTINLAQALGPLVAVLAISHLGGYPALFGLAVIGMLASAALLVPIRAVR
jgi:MFS family permease